MSNFIAQYRSECATCGMYIQKGDEAKIVAFGEAVHVTCPDTMPTPVGPRGVCPQCFVELPVTGVCECRQ